MDVGFKSFFGNLQRVQTKQGLVHALPPVGHAHLAGKKSSGCPTNLIYLLINLTVFSCGSRPNGPGRVTDTAPLTVSSCLGELSERKI